MKYTATINVINSKVDRHGNCYWAFTFVCHETGNRVCATTSGGDSNIRAIARHWNVDDDWDRSIFFNQQEIGYREFNRLTKDWPYGGCCPDELAAFIRKGLKDAADGSGAASKE